MRTRDLKARAEEVMDGYDEAMIEDLLQAAKDELEGMEIESIDEDLWLGIFQSWTPKEPSQWAFDEVQSEVDSYYDAKYEEERDRRMGL